MQPRTELLLETGYQFKGNLELAENKPAINVCSAWNDPTQETVVKQLLDAGFWVFDFKNPFGKPRKNLLHSLNPEGRSTWTANEWLEVSQMRVVNKEHRFYRDALTVCTDVLLLEPCGVDAAICFGIASGVGAVTHVLFNDAKTHGSLGLMTMHSHLHKSVESFIEFIKDMYKTCFDGVVSFPHVIPDELKKGDTFKFDRIVSAFETEPEIHITKRDGIITGEIVLPTDPKNIGLAPLTTDEQWIKQKASEELENPLISPIGFTKEFQKSIVDASKLPVEVDLTVKKEDGTIESHKGKLIPIEGKVTFGIPGMTRTEIDLTKNPITITEGPAFQKVISEVQEKTEFVATPIDMIASPVVNKDPVPYVMSAEESLATERLTREAKKDISNAPKVKNLVQALDKDFSDIDESE